jgi:hypothetical protein
MAACLQVLEHPWILQHNPDPATETGAVTFKKD